MSRDEPKEMDGVVNSIDGICVAIDQLRKAIENETKAADARVERVRASLNSLIPD